MRALARPVHQLVDQRQGEGGGLAGAGLGDAQNVLAGEGDRDGLRLNGGGRGVAGVCDRLKGRGRQPEFGKFCHVILAEIQSHPYLGERVARIRLTCSEAGDK
jgi:hypothetical protein